jgi:hypothetical protein
VLIYVAAIDALHPACGRAVEPVLAAITANEAVVATLIHEIGHTLLLGHETEAGGGLNSYNVMSVPQNCVEAQKRIHGDGNADPTLGATTDVAAPRFSRAAYDLMDFTRILSVATPSFAVEGGYEM